MSEKILSIVFCSEIRNLSISEIIREVGMYFETSFSVPGYLSIFKDFGADQCASSEGFLVTFIPRRGCGEVIFSYSFSSDVIQIQRRCLVTPAGPEASSEPGYQSVTNSLPREGFISIVPVPRELLKVPMGNQSPSRFIRGHREETMRSNVMTPAPQSFGVLVASEPTDEGRIGTGRNTKKNGRVQNRLGFLFTTQQLWYPRER
jgi:hypothetical protein